ncbi:hypothetical protein [Nocardia carnea]|uniref:hypothetical protein n=1 Tax=Nocardia carnea TaxID=37328 RepID=UPI00052687FE|nr:hypothetical protein [Nocardia carnea]
MNGEHSNGAPRPPREMYPAETLTIGTTTYHVEMHTVTATLTGPRGARYIAVQNVHSQLFSIICAKTARTLEHPGSRRPLRLRRTSDHFEIA